MVATSVVRMQYLRLFGSTALWLIGACHVYDAGLANVHQDAGAVDASVDASLAPVVSRDVTDPVADAAMTDSAVADATSPKLTGSTASAVAAATDPTSATCEAGDCWWSTDVAGSCRSAGRPGPQHRPTSQASNDSIPAIFLGWTHVDLGGSASPSADKDDEPQQWETLGLDLDGVCTNSAMCSERKQSCRAAASQIPFDGTHCRDNRFARLQSMLAPVPEIGERYGLREENFNCNLKRGTYNVIVKLSDYNGQPDDSDVRADFYMSPGLARLPPWKCDGSDSGSYPLWTASAQWQIDQADLLGKVAQAGELPQSAVADPNAYVRGGYLVAELPDGAKLRLAGASNSYRSFALTTRKSVWTGALKQLQDGTWQLEDGLVAGITLASDLLETFHELGLCQQMDAAAQAQGAKDDSGFYQIVDDAVRDNSDMLADGRVDENAACDSVSFGIAFRAAQITPGAASAAPERITCCPPTMTAEECSPMCGDGVVTGSEHCDTAIATGESGACLRLCPSIDTCTPQRVSGLDCDAHCVPTPITVAISGDRCCPKGENANTDSDCKAQCGNGAVETGESCEPSRGDCPSSCKSEDACMSGKLKGKPETCNAACEWSRIETCRSGDGCCPSECNQTNDSDCSAACGNGVLEDNERCESGTSTPCPTGCDDGDACTDDALLGSARNCDARCDHKKITAAMGGDGCCPAGASASTDSDCKAVCGNGTREGSEDCDDGNKRSGDGCSADCKSEQTMPTTPTTPSTPTTTTSESQCLDLLGNPTDNCSGCLCSSCQQEVLACRGAKKSDEAAQCNNVFSCAAAKGCFGLACYCQLSGNTCASGTPDGPCHKEIEAAAHSSVPSEVIARFNDTNYPLGRVTKLTTCWGSSCGSACQP